MDTRPMTTVKPPTSWWTTRPGATRHRLGWRGVLGVVSLILFPGIALPFGSVEAADEMVGASVSNDWMHGEGWPADTSVDVWVTESDGVTVKGSTTVTTDGSGVFGVDNWMLGVDIVFGDVVFATDGAVTKDVIMEAPLSINVQADPAYAWGELPVGAEIGVHVSGSACDDFVSVFDSDNDGDWAYDFSATCPDGLGVFAGGEVYLSDADGDNTVAEAPPERRIGASPTDDWIAGSGLTPNSSVDVWVNAGPPDPPAMTVGTDYSGGFFTDAGIDLVHGDLVLVEDALGIRELTLADPLSIEVAVGPPAGASGDLPLGSGIQVDVGGAECSAGAWVDDIDDGTNDESWSVDFTAECPTGLGPDVGGQAVHFDADTDVTVVSMPQPPQIRVSVTNNWVNGGGFEADASVDIWVNADPDVDPATGNAGTDSEGSFWWDPGLDLGFGDGVVVRDTLIERALILTGPLSIEADLDARTANGTLPIGDTVRVEMNGEDCGTGIEVADGDDGTVDGFWSADLSGECPGGLGPNAGAQVVLYDGDGDATVAEPPQPPQIRVSVTGDWMEGFGFPPNAPVEIWVNADPVLDPPTEVVASDPGGNFDWGFDFDLMFGDEVVARNGLVERYLMLEGPLSIEADLDAMTAFGDLPVGAEVGVEMNGNECGTWVDVADGDDGADDGAWSVDASGDCPGGLGGDAGARVLLHDADGDATMVDAPQPPQLWANPGYDWVQGFGFAPNGSVELWINADPLVDPPTDIVGTDGGGQFWFNPPVGLSFGDGIHASDGVIERHLLVEGPLSIEVDGPSATASGELPVGAGVAVGIGGNDCGANVEVADGDDGTVDGFWFVDVAGDCPGGLGDNAGGQVFLFDADGDATVAEPPQPPQFAASTSHPGNDSVHGLNFMPWVPIDIAINPDPGPPDHFFDDATTPDAWGNFGVDLGIDLLPDDVVLLEQDPDGVPGSGDELVRTTTLLDLTFDQIDVVADVASGTAAVPDGTEVDVHVGNAMMTATVTSGVWIADFSTIPHDITEDMGGWATVEETVDPDGDGTIAWPPQPPQIQASVTNHWIQGWGMEPNGSVEIWINADPVLDPPTGVETIDGNGNFQFNPPIPLSFGDEIVTNDGAIERFLLLEGPLSIEVDGPSATAWGELPIGAGVAVGIGGNECGYDVEVEDGDDGATDGLWSVDVSGDCPGGLGDNAGGQVYLFDVDGDATVAEPPQPPQIQASLTNHWIQGWGFAPDSPVEIWINVDPAGPPTDTVDTDSGGYFNYNPQFPIGIGDEITTSDGAIERYLLLEGPLSIEVDGPTATASGELPIGYGVNVGIGGDDCGANVEVEDGDDGTVDGFWFVDVSGDCPGGLGDNVGGQVMLPDADGDATVAEPPQPPQIQASLTNHWIQGWGFAPDSPVEIWINVDPTGPPTDTVGTDSGGYFNYNPQFPIGVGDEITTSDGAIERYLLLEGPLSIVVDPASASAFGELPSGRGVQVQLNGPNCGSGAWIEDSFDGVDGLWSVDLSGDCPDGLGGDWGSNVQLFDSDGDATVVETSPAPRIATSVTYDWIEGYNLAPSTPVDIWINGDQVTTVATDGGGGFYIESPSFGDANLVLGDVIEVDDGTTVKTLSLDGPMTIDVVDDPAGASGELPLGARVFLSVFSSDCGDYFNLEVDDGSDGAVDGLWALDLSPECPGGLGTGWDAQIDRYDSDGDATIVMWVPPGDTDGDGLSDADERNLYGTDWNNADTDSDDLDDGDEVTRGTNPLKADTDSDDLDDGDEVTRGTNPLKADTDSDDLDDGDEVTRGTNPLKADTDSDDLDDGDEVTRGTNPLKADTDSDDLDDGDEVTRGTNPLKADTDSDDLDDGDEVTRGTNPLKADTDSDDLDDGDEVTRGTNPLKADTDSDDLDDGDEVTRGTNPLKADTDSDDLDDGDEVTRGTNPLKADTDGGTVNDGDEVGNGTNPLDPSDDVAQKPALPPLEPLLPARILETRLGPNEVTVDHLFEHLGRQAAGSTLELVVAGRGGVPADAEAVMLNLTAVFPSAHGFLTVFPCGSTLPVASNVNYGPGEVAPNAVLAKIGVGGKVCIYTLAETDLIADVNGYVPAGGSPSSVVPARLLETRLGPNEVTVDRLFEDLGRQAAGSTLELVVAGRGGVPADAEAVMLNLTAVFPSAPGFLTVFPCGSSAAGGVERELRTW